MYKHKYKHPTTIALANMLERQLERVVFWIVKYDVAPQIKVPEEVIELNQRFPGLVECWEGLIGWRLARKAAWYWKAKVPQDHERYEDRLHGFFLDIDGELMSRH
jgi:hypothetical protein